MNKMLKAALDYAEDGWPVFPCRANKAPFTANGVLDATTDREQILAWWKEHPTANIGLDCGTANLMVLDLDPGHDLQELEKNIGPLPKTKLVQVTPRGGRHLFYELKNGERVPPSASKIAKNVDVRSFNSYVLLEPSKTADGEYSWESFGDAAYRSKGMITAASAVRERSEDHDVWTIEPDLDENIEAAVKWLRSEAKVSVQGQGGDHIAYATAAHLKSYGISEASALELMVEHWNPRCVPPWGDDELDHLENKVRNGYKYNTSPPGNITPAFKVAKQREAFKPARMAVDNGGFEAKAGRWRIIDRQGAMNMPLPTWLIKDLIPDNSFSILFGAPGSFKTFVALDIALSVANGIVKSPTWPELNPGPVLFAVGEGRATINKRILAWEKEHGITAGTENFFIIDPVPHMAEDLDAFYDLALDALPEEYDGFSLTVIDTIGRAMQGQNENSQEHASAFTRMVEEIQRELGGSVLALHHTGHENKERERGSTVFGADADARFRLDRVEPYTVKLFNVKQKDAEEHDPVILKLKEVIVDMEEQQKSLVVIRPKQDKTAASTKETDRKRVDNTMLETINAAVLEELKAIKPARLSQSKLAERIALRDDIEMTSEYLRHSRGPLTRIRENRRQYSAGWCFDIDDGKGTWAYRKKSDI